MSLEANQPASEGARRRGGNHGALPQLAAEFYQELRRFIVRAAERPGVFAVREHDLRRANLARFPYHFLFRVQRDVLRVLVVRHHRQRPAYGLRRR